MDSGFAGFPPEAMTFFRGLVRNNNREWFLPRKQLFLDKVRGPMETLVTALNAELIRFAPEYVTDPGKAIYRFYRDTRFSDDKTPYKDHIAALFSRRGAEKHRAAAYYLSVSHKEIEVAGGLYMPRAEELMAVRRHLEQHHARFRRIIAEPKLRELMGEFTGDQLARVPKGFCSTHPAADLLRYKQFLFYQMLDAKLATTPALFTEIAARFRALKPLIDFINTPIAGLARKPVEADFV
jgi:uncharacterized protein (TIGR02453 family)